MESTNIEQAHCYYINWSLCIICQEISEEKLRCLLRNLNEQYTTENVYGSFVSNIVGFQAIGQLPVHLKCLRKFCEQHYGVPSDWTAPSASGMPILGWIAYE